MLCTIIKQIYKLNEINDIAFAIDDLCSPKDNYGWSSAGVYSFWNPKTKEILYIGLAVDLTLRFKQHNGIVKSKRNSSKYREVKRFLEENGNIGYTIFVQATFSQPVCRRFNINYGLSKENAENQYNDLVKHGHETIVESEGALIEYYRKINNAKPIWNKIGGSTQGATKACSDHGKLLKMFSGELDSWLVARKSIQELSNNTEQELFEEYLHNIRLISITHQISFKEAIKVHHQRMGDDDLQKYLRKNVFQNQYIPNELFS